MITRKALNLTKIQSRFFILVFAFLLFGISCLFFLYILNSVPKVAYVRNLELVYGYNGMKQAHDEYKTQADLWQSNIDTLNQTYREKLAFFRENEKKWSSKEKSNNMDELKRLEYDIQKYSSVVKKQAQENDLKITESILLQITTFVESYAQEHGYDIVLGAQGDGSVLYGDKYYDITEDVLQALNKEYKYIGPRLQETETAKSN